MTDIKYKLKNCYTDLKQQSTEKQYLFHETQHE
jgi:hypothetical protein